MSRNNRTIPSLEEIPKSLIIQATRNKRKINLPPSYIFRKQKNASNVIEPFTIPFRALAGRSSNYLPLTLQRSSNRFSARSSSFDEIVLKRGIDQPGSIRSLKYAEGWTRPCTGVRLPTRVPCQVSNSIRVADIRPYIRSTSHELKFAAQSIRGGCPWHVHMTLFRASQFSWNNIPSMWMGDVSLRYFRRTVTRHE